MSFSDKARQRNSDGKRYGAMYMMRPLVATLVLILTLSACSTNTPASRATATPKATATPESTPTIREVAIYLNDELVPMNPPARFDDNGSTVVPVSGANQLGLTEADISNVSVTIDGDVYIPLRYYIDNYADDFRWDKDTRSAYLYKGVGQEAETASAEAASPTDAPVEQSAQTTQDLLYEDDYIYLPYPSRYTIKSAEVTDEYYKLTMESTQNTHKIVFTMSPSGYVNDPTFSEEGYKQWLQDEVNSAGTLTYIDSQYFSDTDSYVCAARGSFSDKYGNDRLLLMGTVAKLYNTFIGINYTSQLESDIQDLMDNYLYKAQVKEGVFTIGTEGTEGTEETARAGSTDENDIAQYLVISEFGIMGQPYRQYSDTGFLLENRLSADLTQLSITLNVYDESDVLLGEYRFQTPSTIKAGSTAKIKGVADVNGAAYVQIVVKEGGQAFTSDEWVYGVNRQ